MGFVMALLLTGLAILSVGTMTWGLMSQPGDADWIMKAVLGLLAYIGVWALGLYVTQRSSESGLSN